MQSIASSLLPLVASFAALGLVPAALAHGDDMDMSQPETPGPAPEYAPTYFGHPEHRGVIYAHIAIMVLAWVCMMPVGTKTPQTPPEKKRPACQRSRIR
jgi:hypothetical protein